MDTIRYVGTAARRLISEKDWETAGVTGQDTVVWDLSNGYTVDASKLSAAAKDAIRPDPFFFWSDKEAKGDVEQEETIDVDLAAEYEANAKSGSTSADGTGLDQAAATTKTAKNSPKRGE